MPIPNVQELNVAINGTVGYNSIKLKQYDKNTRRIEITLIDNDEIVEIPSTYIAKFQATKRDGTIVFDDCEPIVNNIIVYKPDEQLTSLDGDVECEIGLYEPDATGDTTKDKLIQSATFKIIVKKSAMDRNAIISSNSFNTLTIAINALNGAIAAEIIRVFNENTRISRENTRVSSESGRVTAENGRVSAETTRVNNENARKVFENYNNTKAYVVGNKVVYNGSSYVNILACTGILPTSSTTNWLQTSAAGGSIINALQLPITDIGGYYPVDDVNSALQKAGEQIVGLTSTFNSQNVLLKRKSNKVNLVELLDNNLVSQIKWIGDSISAGYFATGAANGTRLIYSTYYESNYTSPCYMNFFRTFLTSKYPSVDLFNAGISAKSIKDLKNDKALWIGTNNNVLVISLGVNDLVRLNTETLLDFKNDYKNIIDYALLNSDYLFLATTPPILNYPGATSSFSIDDINRIITILADEYDLPLIDIYNTTFKRAHETGLDISEEYYTATDKVHPSDKGHLTIWDVLQLQLGFKSSYTSFLNKLSCYKKDVSVTTDWTKTSGYVSKNGIDAKITLNAAINNGVSSAGALLVTTLPAGLRPLQEIVSNFIYMKQDGVTYSQGLISIGSNGGIYVLAPECLRIYLNESFCLL